MTTRPATSAPLTIFEGPDGSGKTTIAREYAELTGARYVHHGPYPRVGSGLSRIVLESMLPAIHGYQPVVLDRCWVSEPIYGDAYRKGRDRVGIHRSRVLDRVALRCGGVVVKCLPPWAHVRACFTSRVADEYLDNEQQLLQIYGQYQHDLNTDLHEVEYDYTQHLNKPLGLVATELKWLVEKQRLKSPPHSTLVNSAGNWHAPVVLVGENFAVHKDVDSHYQWPFGSLSGAGCSLWLSRKLHEAGISEQSILWINADELVRVPAFVEWHPTKTFIALGGEASLALRRLNCDRHSVAHPQYWKRFRGADQYPLLSMIKEAVNAPVHSY